MSQDKRELLRPILAEWAKGNLWVGAELMAPDITFQAAPPANFVAHGLEETVRVVPISWITGPRPGVIRAFAETLAPSRQARAARALAPWQALRDMAAVTRLWLDECGRKPHPLTRG
jgi:hypothetical protein